jgi:large subunit ribosomal protein L32e
LRPSGHKVFLVHNARDVDLLLMYNRTYAAEIGMLSSGCLILASAVGAKKRAEIVEKAKKLGVAVTNGNARLSTEE